MLTDQEVATIRRKLADAWRGLVLLTWLEQLLQGPGGAPGAHAAPPRRWVRSRRSGGGRDRPERLLHR
jgi:hypothetical protein